MNAVTNAQVWHRRLGHLNKRSPERMYKNWLLRRTIVNRMKFHKKKGSVATLQASSPALQLCLIEALYTWQDQPTK